MMHSNGRSIAEPTALFGHSFNDEVGLPVDKDPMDRSADGIARDIAAFAAVIADTPGIEPDFETAERVMLNLRRAETRRAEMRRAVPHRPMSLRKAARTVVYSVLGATAASVLILTVRAFFKRAGHHNVGSVIVAI